MLHKFLVKYLSISQKMSNFAPVFEKTLKKYILCRILEILR